MYGEVPKIGYFSRSSGYLVVCAELGQMYGVLGRTVCPKLCGELGQMYGARILDDLLTRVQWGYKVSKYGVIGL
jgi:hypothetical protein